MRSLRGRTAAAVIGGALAVVLGTSACGAQLDRQTLVAKLSNESDLAGVTPTGIGCMADVMLKYVDRQELTDYVRGDRQFENVGNSEGRNEQTVATELAQCVTGGKARVAAAINPPPND